MLLSRYEAGEFEEVWREFRSRSTLEGDFRDEALAVAEAAMRRVARNTDILAERLHARGWHPLTPEACGLRSAPSADDEEIFSQIEEVSGASVPPTLLAFWKTVGGINFVWDYESGKRAPDLGVALPMDEMDPLCVYPPSAVPYQLEEWADLQSELGDSEPFPIALAPDFLHKANVSGGEAYSILVPFAGADPVLTHETHELPFLDYLRLAFRWAAFPGLEAHANRDDIRRFVEEFGCGLEPF